MIRAILALCVLLMSAACGLKADPRSKAALDIPMPTFAISINESGVNIRNTSGLMLMVERAESEIGDLTPPAYDDIALLESGQSFADSDSEFGKRYIYRFRSYDRNYNAYSASVTRVVSYRAAVRLDNVTWTLEPDSICISAEPTAGVARTQVIVNGNDVGAYGEANSCYPLPAVSNIVLLMVPYSDSDTPGNAFSASITRDLAEVLLPPQNIVILRRTGQITLSWDAIPNVSGYRVYTGGGVRNTESTLVMLPASDTGCTTTELSTMRGGEESPRITVESCP
jgi:hypothetical protein